MTKRQLILALLIVCLITLCSYSIYNIPQTNNQYVFYKSGGLMGQDIVGEIYVVEGHKILLIRSYDAISHAITAVELKD